MANGYQHYNLLRMSPQNGRVEVLDLMLAFTESKGPTSTVPAYSYIADQREDINNNIDVIARGFRMSVTMTIDFFAMADEAVLLEIVRRAGETMIDGSRAWDFDLSIDGGINFHPVLLRSGGVDGPDGHANKTIAGNRWRTTWHRIGLLDAIPLSDPGAGAPVGLAAFLPTVWQLPTASESNRGYVYLLRRAGLPDEAFISLGDGIGGFGYLSWAYGGALLP
jgi:hypothetical protein